MPSSTKAKCARRCPPVLGLRPRCGTRIPKTSDPSSGPWRRTSLSASARSSRITSASMGSRLRIPPAIRDFLRGFIAPSDRGELIAAWDDGRVVGFANLYWTFSNVAAGPIVLLNDLFVVEAQRRAGIGRRLIEFSLRRAEERGASRLERRTELDNRVAQRLYEKFDAVRTVWF